MASKSALDEQLASYRSDLASVSDEAALSIRRLVAMQVPADVTHASVEVFIDEYGGTPNVWIYFQGRNNRVDHSDQSIFPGRAMKLDLKLDGLAQIDEESVNADSEILNHAANVFVRWFTDCWRAGGGSTLAIPITLSVHDGFGDGASIELAKNSV